MSQSNIRRRRFARTKRTQEIWITDRALSILRALMRFRFLTIDQIISLLNIEPRIYALPPVSGQKVSRLLRDLYDARYVERVLGPVTNLTDFAAVHRHPTVYALAQDGAEHLSVTDHVPLDHIDWKQKNECVGSLHIDHTAGVAGTIIAFLTAAKDYGLDLIDHHDLVPYMPPALRDPKALTLSVTVDGVEYTRRPDRLFAIAGNTNRRLPFALEWHSGEIPNRRDAGALWRGYRQTNFADTIWIYWNARNAGAFKTNWGAHGFRILTITASDESIVNLSRLVARITEHPLTKLFLFTTPARLFKQHPFAPIWFAPQHTYDQALHRHTLLALRAAAPISILENSELATLRASTDSSSLMSTS
jgi:hypothetical protein